MVVVFPEPLGPTKPQMVPSGTSKFACESAYLSPYFFERSLTSSARLLTTSPYQSCIYSIC